MKVVGLLGGRFDFFSHLGFEIQSNFDYRTSKIKFYSVRAKCYLNDKNLIHGQVTATISEFRFMKCTLINLKQNTGGPEHNFLLQQNNKFEMRIYRVNMGLYSRSDMDNK